MFVAIALFLVGLGTVVFHFISPWWFTPIASNWGFIDTTMDITFWVTGAVFIAIMLFMSWCVYRYRNRPGNKAEYEPENSKLEWQLTIATTLGVIIMLAPGLWAWKDFVTVPEGASEVEVVAKQWGWQYRFPGKDGILGKSNARLINDDNPLGVDPKDPNGQDDVLIDDSELHLPLGKPVKMLLRSIDVLHNFTVVQLRAKMDMVPGAITYFWFTPIRTGTFDVLCYELCGVGHYNMRGLLVVEKDSDFQAWLAEQPTFAQSMAAIENREPKSLQQALNETGSLEPGIAR